MSACVERAKVLSKELKSGRGEPRRAEPNSRLSYRRRSSPPSPPPHPRAHRATSSRRDGAAANEVNRAAARSVTKERNIAGTRYNRRHAALFCLYIDAPPGLLPEGTMTRGRRRVYLRDSQKRRPRRSASASPSLPSPLVSRGKKSSPPVSVRGARVAERIVRFLSSLHRLAPVASKQAIFTAVSEAIDTPVCHAAPRRAAPVKACVFRFRGKGFSTASTTTSSSRNGAKKTPRGDTLLRKKKKEKKKSRVTRAHFFSPSPFLNPLPTAPGHRRSATDHAPSLSRTDRGKERDSEPLG